MIANKHHQVIKNSHRKNITKIDNFMIVEIENLITDETFCSNISPHYFCSNYLFFFKYRMDK